MRYAAVFAAVFAFCLFVCLSSMYIWGWDFQRGESWGMAWLLSWVTSAVVTLFAADVYWAHRGPK